ncbi:MAG: helix-turn-helix domain-containing protein [Candidatus Brocadiales bacterium]|nr:helix-turn-helix domain-containing protein [Candidatus Brocadiales bacterium]
MSNNLVPALLSGTQTYKMQKACRCCGGPMPEGYRPVHRGFSFLGNPLVDCYLSQLSGSALKVFLILLRLMDKQTYQARVSYDRIATYGVGRGRVSHAIKTLTGLGLITVVWRGNSYNKTCNTYGVARLC